MKASVFDRFPKSTLIAVWVLFGSLSLIVLEKGARHFGLGEVVIYASHPVHGYRPIPDQSIHRFNQSEIKINNLGLRANSNWDISKTKDKVLFLGDSVTYGGSYIDNSDLFSAVAVKDTSYAAGNAGVNGWGVLNIHGLIKNLEFLPAETYVTLLPEGDFYRGLSRLGGQPYWTKKASYALEELFFYGLYKLYLKKTPGLGYSPHSNSDNDIVVNIAAKHLKEMDDFIKAKGYKHIVVISPSRTQAKQLAPKSPDIQKALAAHGIQAHYFLDHFTDYQGDVESLYHDETHLTKEGHAQWGAWLNKFIS